MTTTALTSDDVVLAPAIYVRASKDTDKTRSSTKRQIECGRRRLAEKGLPEPLIIFEDDDVSAAKRGITRDDFMAMIAAMPTGQFNVVWVWEKERLNRRLTDFELVTDVAVDHGIRFLVDDKWFDPADDDEWAMAGIGAVLGSREVRKLRRRVLAGVTSHAQAGKPYGPAGFGYRATYKLGPGGVQDRKTRVDVVHEPERAILLDLAEKVIGGAPINALCRSLEDQEIRTSRGNQRWSQASLKALLLRPKLVGDRDRRGIVVAQGLWEPIFDRDTFNALKVALEQPRPRSQQNRLGGRGRPPSRLLAGVALCGVCDHVVYCDKIGERVNYACSHPRRHVCRSVTISEEVVTDHVLTFLASDEAREIVEASHSDAGRRVAAEVEEVRSRLKAAAKMYAKELIDDESLMEINGELRPRLAELEARLAEEHDAPVFADLIGPNSAALWDAIGVQRQRAVVAELFVVRILPVGKGRKAGREHTEVIPRVRFMPAQV